MAKESYACIIFNWLTLHTPSGIEASAAFVPRIKSFGDSARREHYLTYHKFAKPEQVIGVGAIANSKNF